MPSEREMEASAGWLPRAGSWEEAVLDWHTQVENAFRRLGLGRRGDSAEVEPAPEGSPAISARVLAQV